MAQKTAFLDSSAVGYNRDFHHTAIHNALLKEVGVMFSDLENKPEFQLGNGTIEAGSCIVKCIKSTGINTGKEVLAFFDLTIQDTVDIAGNKKIYIEIPQGYIDDATTITDAITLGQNLGVGVLKSTVNYPTHPNYTPLWEITGGDWANAIDVRPENRRFGRKNSMIYFDNNGKETRIDLDATSTNKFLKSNGPANAPTFDSISGGVEVKATKLRYRAGEDLVKADIITNNPLSTFTNATTELNIGDTSSTEKRAFNIIGNGISNTDIKISLKQVGGPSDNFEVRIETDSGGNATGLLADTNAVGTITGSSVGGTLTDQTINWAGNFTLTDGNKYHLVLQRSGSISATNYYVIGVETRTTRTYKQQTYNGSSWGSDITTYSPYISMVGIYNNLKVKAKADDTDLIQIDGVATTNVNEGVEFVADITGTSDVFTSLDIEKYYLSNTAGLISTTPGTNMVLVGRGISDTELLLGSNGGGGSSLYEAIVDINGGGDYTNIDDALNDGKTILGIKEGNYTIVGQKTLSDKSITLHGYGEVSINITTTSSIMFDMTTANYRMVIDIKNIIFNINTDRDFEIFRLHKTGSGTLSGDVNNVKIDFIASTDANVYDFRFYNSFDNGCDLSFRNSSIYLTDDGTAHNLYLDAGGDTSQRGYVAYNCSYKVETSVSSGNHRSYLTCTGAGDNCIFYCKSGDTTTGGTYNCGRLRISNFTNSEFTTYYCRLLLRSLTKCTLTAYNMVASDTDRPTGQGIDDWAGGQSYSTGEIYKVPGNSLVKCTTNFTSDNDYSNDLSSGNIVYYYEPCVVSNIYNSSITLYNGSKIMVSEGDFIGNYTYGLVEFNMMYDKQKLSQNNFNLYTASNSYIIGNGDYNIISNNSFKESFGNQGACKIKGNYNMTSNNIMNNDGSNTFTYSEIGTPTGNVNDNNILI